MEAPERTTEAWSQEPRREVRRPTVERHPGVSEEPSRTAVAGTFAERVEGSVGERMGDEETVAGPESAGSSGFESLFDLGRLKSGEWWLSKIGISLLLFGVAFLFKFSWDQGWLQVLLTPVVRVGIGLSVGAGLLFVGLRVYEERRSFARVLLGGSIGTFYITGFAAFQIYGLVPHAVAFGFMAGVTLLAFALSVHESEPSLSLIAVTGGLATPFVLYAGSGAVDGLVLYTCGILAGASAIYLYKGWNSLLILAGFGGWLVLATGYYDAVYPVGAGPVSEKWAIQLGAIFAWLTLWAVPVAREVLRERQPERWPPPESTGLVGWLFPDENILRNNAPAHAFSLTMPLLALAFTQGAWGLEAASTGWVSLGGAAVYACVAYGLRSVEGGRTMAYTQGFVALVLGTLAVVLLLDGSTLLFTLAAEAAALHFVGRRLRDRILTWEAHAIFAVVATWFGYRLLSGVSFVPGTVTPGFLDIDTFVDLAVVALAFAASTALPPLTARVYRVSAHAALLGVICAELVPLTNGGTWVLCASALYALVLHGLSRRHPQWGTVAGSHVLSAIVGLALFLRLAGGYALGLVTGYDSAVVFDLRGIGDLAVMLLAVAVARVLAAGRAAAGYRIAACAALSLWLLRELSALDYSHGYVLLAWIAFAGALFMISRRLGDGGLLVAAHVQLAAAGVVFVPRLLAGLVNGPQGVPVLGPQSLVDLGVILAFVVASRYVSNRQLTIGYRMVVHVALLAWFWRELSILSNGDAFVTIAWGLYAVGLLVAGLRSDRSWLMRVSMATLFLVVGKLFAWDLSGVDAIWRILLFLGFGGLFLGLGYYLQSLWKPGDGAEQARQSTGPHPARDEKTL